MAANIVTPFVADEVYSSSARAKCIAIAEAWLGSGSTAAVSTWGDYHTLVNAVLTAASLTTIADGITGQQWLDRMNALNNAEQVIAGLGGLAWWNADRSDLLTLSGSQVTSWKDSFNAYDATQAVSGSRPVYSATGFNGAPGLTLDGVDDELTLATMPFPAVGAASEIWGLVQQDALTGDAAARSFFSYGGGGANTSRRAYRITGNRGQVQVGSGGASVTATNTTADFAGRVVNRSIVGTAASQVNIDSTAGASAAVTPNTGATRARIGAIDGTSASAFWNGKVRDILVTPALSAGPASYLLNFLKSRRML